MKSRTAVLVAFLSLFLLAGSASAESERELNHLISDASYALVDIATARETNIPDYLLSNCDAIVILPEMYKGGLIIGGSVGKGVISVKSRQTGEWSSPAFIEVVSGSFGWQIGIEKSELVLVIVGRKAVEMFLEDSFKLGADASIAAGPIGRKGQAAVDYKLDNQIYSYSKTKGLFAGISLEGSVVSVLGELNGTYYGSGTTPADILMRQNVQDTGETNNLKRVLNKYIK